MDLLECMVHIINPFIARVQIHTNCLSMQRIKACVQWEQQSYFTETKIKFPLLKPLWQPIQRTKNYDYSIMNMEMGQRHKGRESFGIILHVECVTLYGLTHAWQSFPVQELRNQNCPIAQHFQLSWYNYPLIERNYIISNILQPISL